MAKKAVAKSSVQECFVIMPVSDPDGSPSIHFRRVFDDLIAPACQCARFKPVRSDEVKQTNLIHLEVLRRLINAPMVICDLSTRNPNVLFELGVRQAFNLKTVLIAEEETPRIFDMHPLRIVSYNRELRYRSVLDAQLQICEALKATRDAEGDINSLIRILEVAPATLTTFDPDNTAHQLHLLRAEMLHLFQNATPPSPVAVEKTRADCDLANKYETVLHMFGLAGNAAQNNNTETAKKLISDARELLYEYVDELPSEDMKARMEAFSLIRRMSALYFQLT